VGILGAHLSEKFRIVRDVVILAISIYTLLNIHNFYTQGYLDGVKDGYELRANPIFPNMKDTICFKTENCTLFCNEIAYKIEEINNSFVPIKYAYVAEEVKSFCLDNLDGKKFALIGG